MPYSLEEIFLHSEKEVVEAPHLENLSISPGLDLLVHTGGSQDGRQLSAALIPFTASLQMTSLLSL